MGRSVSLRTNTKHIDGYHFLFGFCSSAYVDNLVGSPSVENAGLVSDEYIAACVSNSPVPNLKDTAAAAEAVNTNLRNAALLDTAILGMTAVKQNRFLELIAADPFLTGIAVTKAILKVMSMLPRREILFGKSTSCASIYHPISPQSYRPPEGLKFRDCQTHWTSQWLVGHI